MNTPPQILITGATGKVGGAALQGLLTGHRAEQWRLVAAIRQPGHSKLFDELGIESRHLNFDDAERFGLDAIRPAFRGINRMLLVTGYTFDMVEQSKSAVDAAKLEGVEQIVHLGACGDDDTTIAHWTWHQLVERYIEWQGFQFTHLRPEWYMSNLLPAALENRTLTSYIGEARVSWIDPEDVGAFAAAALSEPALYHSRVYRMGTQVCSYAEIATVLSEVFGKKFSVRHETPQKFLIEMVKAGGNEAYFRCVENQFIRNAEGSIPGADQEYREFESMLRHPATTWTEFAAKFTDT